MSVSKITIRSDKSLQLHECDNNCVIIRGERILLKEILNDNFFKQSSVTDLGKTFRSNTPFPHVIVDGLFSPTLLDLVNADFDALIDDDWRLHYSAEQIKLGSRAKSRLGHATQLYFNTIYSGPFVSFLESITGIERLVTNPTLCNGGLHQMPTGGKFDVHADFNQDERTGLYTRHVFITYLNRNWLASYGGALELWTVDEHKCKVIVEPVFGRSILFFHSPRSLHGLPNPICAPTGCPRRSAAAYYYNNECPEGETANYHSTAYPYRAAASVYKKFKSAVEYVTPPALTDAAWGAKMLLHRSLIRFNRENNTNRCRPWVRVTIAAGLRRHHLARNVRCPQNVFPNQVRGTTSTCTSTSCSREPRIIPATGEISA